MISAAPGPLITRIFSFTLKSLNHFAVRERQGIIVLLIWRGWGLLAVVSLFPLLASCGGLIEVQPKWIFGIATSVSLLFAGAVCIHCGNRWNYQRTEHSFYFIPLQFWGWIYLSFVLLISLMWFLGGVYRVFEPLPGKPGPGDPDPIYVAITGGTVLIAGITTIFALMHTAKPRSAEEESFARDSNDSWESKSSME